MYDTSDHPFLRPDGSRESSWCRTLEVRVEKVKWQKEEWAALGERGGPMGTSSGGTAGMWLMYGKHRTAEYTEQPTSCCVVEDRRKRSFKTRITASARSWILSFSLSFIYSELWWMPRGKSWNFVIWLSRSPLRQAQDGLPDVVEFAVSLFAVALSLSPALDYPPPMHLPQPHLGSASFAHFREQQ
ncbi:hypothetical protein BJ138DRAFT_1107223 [Hygrophoropsis aurantiaca]|uniref:Uncharacterized protein n=1 Tax=Hygrophoropsis aurantiaca TaxID=72124 RepID=A0ACB7ZTD8_9AGAM|nr:hypothetical protein BJ138DRAFT_1107223 [Hygrophoropsis aurantiaca]